MLVALFILLALLIYPGGVAAQSKLDAAAAGSNAASAKSEPAPIKTKAVIALADMRNGETIAPAKVAASTVLLSQIAPGVPTQEEHTKSLQKTGVNRSSFYATRVADVAGRISLGLRKGQILYFNLVGFGGDTVVVATKNVSAGAVIGRDCVREQKLNPNIIPVYYCGDVSDVIGSKSSGIKSGEVLVFEHLANGRRRFGSAAAGPHANRIKVERVSAKRSISKGEVFSANNLVHDIEWVPRLGRFELIEYVAHPEGARAAVDMVEGQVIFRGDVQGLKRP